MTIADAIANIALGISGALGVGYHDAVVHWPGTPTYDGGGSIAAPGTSVSISCSVQVDSVTERMRQTPGYTEKDMALFILAATLDGEMDTDGRVEVLEGPHTGIWAVDMADRDPAGVYWQCRGRLDTSDEADG